MLRRILPDTEVKEKKVEEKENKQAEPKEMPTHLSNKDPVTSHLSTFLDSSPEPEPNQDRSDQPGKHLKVDISLRTPVSAPPSIILFFSSPDNSQSTTEKSNLSPITIRIDVLPGGRIEVPDITGIPIPETDLSQLRGKLAGVLATCEDLGMFTEWLLRWVRKQVKN